MTGRQPTVVTSRRRQHELLRTWTTWTLTQILIDPAPEVASARDAGWSGTHHHDPDTGLRIVGSPEGLGFGVDESWHNPSELIPWPEVEAIATGLPEDARQDLMEFRSRWREHQRAYPRFIPSAAAVGCGPIVPDTPLTASQETYQRDLEAYETSGVLPAWKQKRSDLEAEHRHLHAQSLPLGSTSEPEDLLELLNDQTVNQPPAQVVEPIGTGREQIPVAEVRRTLTVGSRVQVFYLSQQREQNTPDIRTVSKQTTTKMVTTSAALPEGSHLHWAGATAERDNSGILIVRDAQGTPCVAYKPLSAGAPEPAEAVLPIDPSLQARYTESREATDPATLDEIARSDNPLNRRYVAENPHASTTVLDQLAADVYAEVRRAVAKNPHTLESTLDRLATDPDEAKGPAECKVRWLVASNPSTSPATLSRLTHDNDAMVLAAIGRNPNTPSDTLEQLATPPVGRLDPDVRHAIATNPSTPGHILAGWENSDGWTRPQVAKNPSTPPEVLERLSRDTTTGNSTRAQAATNPSLPVPALFRLAHHDADAWVRQHAARNPNIGAADAHRVAHDEDPSVRRALARNEHVSPVVLGRLQADTDPVVRASLARNPSITPATLQALAEDDNPTVRTSAVKNPSAPTVLEQLAPDTAPAPESSSALRPALRPPSSPAGSGKKMRPHSSYAATPDASCGGGVAR